jgi:hypothetical protein
MSFTRADFYGLDFDWYALDTCGQVAQLITGHSPLPKGLFEDESLYREVSNYFDSLKPNKLSTLSEHAKSLVSNCVADFSLSLNEARKGLFIYGEESYGTIHYLEAIPIVPLHVTTLPLHIQEFLSRFYIPEVNFSSTDGIDVLKYFDCV